MSSCSVCCLMWSRVRVGSWPSRLATPRRRPRKRAGRRGPCRRRTPPHPAAAASRAANRLRPARPIANTISCPHRTTTRAGTIWPAGAALPAQPARDTSERRVEVFLPPVYVYAGLHGHRLVMTVHNGSRSAGGRPHANATLDVDQIVTKIDSGRHNEPGLPY
ncbi:MAG: hypothetical protein QOE61_5866 [Micromonosporaceae bacterium]|nr:hypothetical protein [Micromonosporaceae bacterium]